jgi:hypothetical protein
LKPFSKRLLRARNRDFIPLSKEKKATSSPLPKGGLGGFEVSLSYSSAPLWNKYALIVSGAETGNR